ncbi:unnamed protein product [Tuwongella immobilis]|uniref:Uncharacterized protein n=1 Tax=Tuwongella immobilis TaxID=692036 RepID=A0A6C2YVF3_9BACT|nr:unnamed protein product [Tuwongella immobilis]VTS08812.1 unnamed protein product [Tuwongella immobilis]
MAGSVIPRTRDCKPILRRVFTEIFYKPNFFRLPHHRNRTRTAISPIGMRSGRAGIPLIGMHQPKQCGTKRLRFPVTKVRSSRMPIPQGQPLTTQLPITG